METPRKSNFLAIDLFCGCGGLSLGLRRAGFKVVAAIDNDNLSINTYRMNHRRTRSIESDVKSIDPQMLMRDLGLSAGDLDLLAGCPPCQGFSTLRTLNGKWHVDEPMNDLIFEFIRFVRVFSPKALMIENVPALLNDHRLIKFKKQLKSLGYKCNADIFDAQRYGVPQRRLRMIFFAFRGDCPPFAKPVRRRRTVAEAIRKLPIAVTSEDPLHNYSVRRSKRVASLIGRIPKDGGSRTDLPVENQLKCHQSFNGFKDVYGRMAWNTPAPTITGGCINPSRGRFLHPEEDRAISLREAAILQSFPSSYKFDLSKGFYSAAQMVGNAFPPKFAEHHAKSIHKQLDLNLTAIR